MPGATGLASRRLSEPVSERAAPDPLTAELAQLVELDTSGSAVRAAATRCLLDYVGCALAGAATPVVRRLLAAVGGGSADGPCAVIGHAARLAPHDAALVNGTAAHALDFDDENAALCGHPGAVIISTVLALGPRAKATGADLLSAIAVGYEAAQLLGARMNPEHYLAGWHATATLGGMAGAVAGARTLGLSVEETARAISLAASNASGVRAVFGTEAKAVQAGRAASSAVLSVLLAQGGVDIPTDTLESPRGYLRAASGPVEPPPPLQAGRPAICDTAFKYHATCGGAHTLIEGIASIMREHALDPADIQTIDVGVNELSLAAAAIETPATALEAQFCLAHIAAVAVHAYPVLPETLESSLTSSVILETRRKVVIREAPELRGDPIMPAIVTITARGQQLQRVVKATRGGPDDPLDDAALTGKFVALVAPLVGSAETEHLAQAVWRAGDASSVSTLLHTLTQETDLAR